MENIHDSIDIIHDELVRKLKRASFEDAKAAWRSWWDSNEPSTDLSDRLTKLGWTWSEYTDEHNRRYFKSS